MNVLCEEGLLPFGAKASDSLAEDLGMDSVDFIERIAFVQDMCSVPADSKNVFPILDTVSDLFDYFEYLSTDDGDASQRLQQRANDPGALAAGA